MGLWSYRPTTESISALTAQTIQFSDQVIPVGGFQDFVIVTTGANNHLTSGVDSCRVLTNGVPIIDITAAQLRALVESLAPANTIPPAATLRWTLPVSLPRFQLPVSPSQVGIPRGLRTSVQVLLNAANSSAGTALLGWRLLDENVDPIFMPRIIQSNTNVAASSTNARIELKTGPDIVVGYLLPIVSATGLTRVRIVQMLPDGRERQVFHGNQGVLLESQFLENPATLVTTSFLLKLPEPMIMGPGSFIECDTGSASSSTDVYAAVTLVDLRRK